MANLSERVRLRRVVCREFLERVPCSISGGVVDDDEFGNVWLLEDFADDVGNGRCLVVNRHDDREAALIRVGSHGQM